LSSPPPAAPASGATTAPLLLLLEDPPLLLPLLEDPPAPLLLLLLEEIPAPLLLEDPLLLLLEDPPAPLLLLEETAAPLLLEAPPMATPLLLPEELPPPAPLPLEEPLPVAPLLLPLDDPPLDDPPGSPGVPASTPMKTAPELDEELPPVAAFPVPPPRACPGSEPTMASHPVIDKARYEAATAKVSFVIVCIAGSFVVDRPGQGPQAHGETSKPQDQARAPRMRADQRRRPDAQTVLRMRALGSAQI
jgi:hypothetical protein